VIADFSGYYHQRIIKEKYDSKQPIFKQPVSTHAFRGGSVDA
jgi:hypothetical protein